MPEGNSTPLRSGGEGGGGTLLINIGGYHCLIDFSFIFNVFNVFLHLFCEGVVPSTM